MKISHLSNMYVLKTRDITIITSSKSFQNFTTNIWRGIIEKTVTKFYVTDVKFW